VASPAGLLDFSIRNLYASGDFVHMQIKYLEELHLDDNENNNVACTESAYPLARSSQS
jgi:hypothetical protein